jgi:hypothetical protein
MITNLQRGVGGGTAAKFWLREKKQKLGAQMVGDRLETHRLIKQSA